MGTFGRRLYLGSDLWYFSHWHKRIDGQQRGCLKTGCHEERRWLKSGGCSLSCGLKLMVLVAALGPGSNKMKVEKWHVSCWSKYVSTGENVHQSPFPSMGCVGIIFSGQIWGGRNLVSYTSEFKSQCCHFLCFLGSSTAYWLNAWTPELERLCTNPGSITFWLCDFGQVT